MLTTLYYIILTHPICTTVAILGIIAWTLLLLYCHNVGNDMEYNKCSTCGADNGRCGLMITTVEHGKPECKNCHDTRSTGDIVVHAHLRRTEEELNKTFAILDSTKGE